VADIYDSRFEILFLSGPVNSFELARAVDDKIQCIYRIRVGYVIWVWQIHDLKKYIIVFFFGNSFKA
jgi:hypothetical protein